MFITPYEGSLDSRTEWQTVSKAFDNLRILHKKVYLYQPLLLYDKGTGLSPVLWIVLIESQTDV